MEEERKQQRQKPNILVTGTPGVGKTTFSALIAEYVEGFQHLDCGKLVNEKKLYSDWNEEYNVPEFDEDKLCDYLEPLMNEGGKVVDFHTCGFFPERWFDIVILLRCDNTNLYDRLQARDYSIKKIEENVSCEIMEVVSEEVYESYQKDIILELQNDKEDLMEKNIQIVIEALKKWKEQQNK